MRFGLGVPRKQKDVHGSAATTSARPPMYRGAVADGRRGGARSRLSGAGSLVEVIASAGSARRPVRVEALSVLVRAAAVSGVGQMPVPVTVGGVAWLAESRVVVQASRVHLLEAVRPPERLDDGLRAVGADRIADCAVAAGDTREHQVPLRRIAVLLEGLAVLTAPAPPAGGKLAGRHHLDPRRDLTTDRARRFRKDPDSHATNYRRPRYRGRGADRPGRSSLPGCWSATMSKLLMTGRRVRPVPQPPRRPPRTLLTLVWLREPVGAAAWS